eukprot:scaffold219403_cov13-Tisochrysis_lutea.AAC.1
MLTWVERLCSNMISPAGRQEDAEGGNEGEGVGQERGKDEDKAVHTYARWANSTTSRGKRTQFLFNFNEGWIYKCASTAHHRMPSAFSWKASLWQQQTLKGLI